MTRGNQRDKAREANLKKQAALVSGLHIATRPWYQFFPLH